MKRAYSRDLRRGSGLLERHADETLSAEIVDLVGLSCLNNPKTRTEVCQIEIDKFQFGMAADPELIVPPKVRRCRATIRAINLVALAEEKFSKVAAVLTCDSRD